MSHSPDRPLSVAVIGCGAFGRNHARVYHELENSGEPMRLAAVVDPNPSRVEALAREFNCAGYPSVDALLSSATIDAASVAVPTVHHVVVARQLMEVGVDVLIEKPLTPTLGEADELIQLASHKSRIAQVGHLERFNPAVQATLPLITKPMFFEVHRLSVFTPRSLDVDVVLDLMIHDLDAVLAFVQSPVKEIRAAGLPILSNKVDIANARIEFANGCVANLTASRISLKNMRKARFFQNDSYVSIDFLKKKSEVISMRDTVEEESPFALIIDPAAASVIAADEPDGRGYLSQRRTSPTNNCIPATPAHSIEPLTSPSASDSGGWTAMRLRN